MNTPLPPADELALIDRELTQLDARRLYLLARRDWLLRQPALLAWGAPAAQAAPAFPGRPKEASAPSAQNVLLTLGAVLLAVAALAFTLVSWGSLGIGGRSAVLAVVTAAALVTPAPLLRRGLRSTAESVAAVGLLLTVLDAYALFAVGMPDTDAAAYAAGAAAVLAAAWAGYGRALPALRIPLPAALLTAQLPLPLAALAADAGPAELGWALLATAALDLALAASAPARWPTRAAWIPAAVLGAVALLIGLSESAAAASAADAVAPAALLAAVAALGVAAARRIPGAWPAATAGGLAAVAALGGTARPELAPGWAVVAYLTLALPLLAAVRVTALPEPVRLGLARAGAGIAGLAALWGCAAAVTALVGRLRVLDEVWAATTPAAGVPLAQPGVAAPVALLLAAGAAGWLARVLPARPEPAVLAVALGWGGLFTAPLALGLPVATVLAAQLAVTVAAGVLALALACGDAPVLALALALAGVVCAGSAVRADRRALGWAAGVLFVAATWVRLASAGVGVPEAYALPVTLPALAVGFLRRRRDPAASSWTAYGPGLAATLLPSLAAAWGDPYWLRPLLLGAAALGVTLAGAHRRLRAPLLLGGGTLAAVALHELAPYVVQVADALPRWLPPALAGLLLLAVGATYEKRLRDARRLRSALGRLR
ncbi:SCO7613 C-terminal domain-containing membrane protein [Streptomyces goshikiensis]|uniref:SCO7613 C-terminal domain-containing membrane protein n=1 Tax=Streptomyces goshikiensis TaxID=1942 RepID=UPI0036664698